MLDELRKRLGTAIMGAQAFPPTVSVTGPSTPQQREKAAFALQRIYLARQKRPRPDLDEWEAECISHLVRAVGLEEAQRFLERLQHGG